MQITSNLLAFMPCRCLRGSRWQGSTLPEGPEKEEENIEGITRLCRQSGPVITCFLFYYQILYY